MYGWLSDPAVSQIIEEIEAGMLWWIRYFHSQGNGSTRAGWGREVEIQAWLSDPVVSQKVGIRSRNALLRIRCVHSQ